MPAAPTLRPASGSLKTSVKPSALRQANTWRREATSPSPRRSCSAACMSCPSRSSSSKPTRTSTFGSADRVVNLQEDDIDLAIRIGDLPDSSLVATRVGSIRHVVCGSPAYFAQRGTPKSPGQLSTHDCITFDGLMSPDTWKFAVGKSTLSVAIHSRLIVNTAEAAIDAAIAGV